MKVKEYEEFVKGNAKFGLNDINYSMVGLAGETGEIMEWYKKVHLRRTPTKLTEPDLLSELGDCLHYLTRIALFYGWDLKTVMEANVQKLENRHKGEWKVKDGGTQGSAEVRDGSHAGSGSGQA